MRATSEVISPGFSFSKWTRDIHPRRNLSVPNKGEKRKRLYRQRRAAGQCTQAGCSAKPEVGRCKCQKHLQDMAKRALKDRKERIANGVCSYCGTRPQFWGRKCILCRQMYTSNPLPIGARRALREYRNAEAQHSFAQIQNKTRAVAIKLLAGRKVVGEQARALRLYVGVDDGKWRTYSEIAAQMKVSKEWVRKLLLPSKITLASMVEGKLPWPAYERKIGYRVGNESR